MRFDTRISLPGHAGWLSNLHHLSQCEAQLLNNYPVLYIPHNPYDDDDDNQGDSILADQTYSLRISSDCSQDGHLLREVIIMNTNVIDDSDDLKWTFASLIARFHFPKSSSEGSGSPAGTTRWSWSSLSRIIDDLNDDSLHICLFITTYGYAWLTKVNTVGSGGRTSLIGNRLVVTMVQRQNQVPRTNEEAVEKKMVVELEMKEREAKTNSTFLGKQEKDLIIGCSERLMLPMF